MMEYVSLRYIKRILSNICKSLFSLVISRFVFASRLRPSFDIRTKRERRPGGGIEKKFALLFEWRRKYLDACRGDRMRIGED